MCLGLLGPTCKPRLVRLQPYITLHAAAVGWALVRHLVTLDWSPEQVPGRLKRHRILSISHETIYLRVWRDKQCGGEPWSPLRQVTKARRLNTRPRKRLGYRTPEECYAQP